VARGIEPPNDASETSPATAVSAIASMIWCGSARPESDADPENQRRRDDDVSHASPSHHVSQTRGASCHESRPPNASETCRSMPKRSC